MIKYTIQCILVLFILVQCKSPSNQIKDSFTTIDQSLTSSNILLQHSFDSTYNEITQMRHKNEELALHANRFYNATNDAINFIERQKGLLQKLDSNGEKLSVAEELLIKSSAGSEIKKRLFALHNLSYSFLIDQSKEKNLKSALSAIVELQEETNWKLLFEHTPTVSARTILSKFQKDCGNAASIVLDDMKIHLVR